MRERPYFSEVERLAPKPLQDVRGRLSVPTFPKQRLEGKPLHPKA